MRLVPPLWGGRRSSTRILLTAFALLWSFAFLLRLFRSAVDTASAPPPHILVLVVTSHTESSAQRRRAALDSWLSSPPPPGVAVAFVAGRPALGEAVALARLSAEVSPFRVLHAAGVSDSYDSLPDKVAAAFAAAVAAYSSARWVVKVDDDVLLRLQVLHLAAREWESAGAGLIGCLKNGGVQNDPAMRWFEAHALLFGEQYPVHPWGSVYVVSSALARTVAAAERAADGPGGLLRCVHAGTVMC